MIIKDIYRVTVGRGEQINYKSDNSDKNNNVKEKDIKSPYEISERPTRKKGDDMNRIMK
jgi:hypothetical protein